MAAAAARAAAARGATEMLLFEILRVALEALVANKLRSLLTMLGVVIGIAAVITMVALGEGAQRSVEQRLATLGANVLTVRPGQSFFGGGVRGQAQLTADDAEALLESPRHILGVAPEVEERLQVEHSTGNASLSIVGTWTSYFDVNNFTLTEGRLFTPAEDRGRRRVAVLGALAGESPRPSSSPSASPPASASSSASGRPAAPPASSRSRRCATSSLRA